MRTLRGICSVLLVFATAAAIDAPPAGAVTRVAAVRSAASYAFDHGYKVGIAVYDTRDNRLYGGGWYKNATFASESVIKVMIATRLLLQGRMHGTTARRAYKMIIQSDDAIASSLYGSVGGDGLIGWIKGHYHVWDLGYRPSRSGWWGNTHIRAAGLVKFYAKVKKDRRVGPWLLNAMHHATKYGSDGTYQFFGLPSATSDPAIKQGWGTDYDDWGKSADFNTTGFVDGDRYAVAILARGPVRTYGSAIGSMLTRAAKLVLPGGHFPDGTPVITYRTWYTGPTSGGQRVRIDGRYFTHVSKVTFGAIAGTHLDVVSSTRLYVTTPPHGAASVRIWIYTDHGYGVTRGRYDYVPPPTVTKVVPASGPMSGGTLVTIYGSNLNRHAWSVRFNGHLGTGLKVLSATELQVRTPPGSQAGPVPVLVHTYYGWSNQTVTFTYTE